MNKRTTPKGTVIQVERWMKQAQHDLRVARKNFAIKVYDVAIIMCEQALEKALKALYIAQKDEMPPRTHSIEFLATATQLRPQLDDALVTLQRFYIRLRYPEESGPMPYQLAARKEAGQDIKMTAAALRMIRDEIRSLQS